MRLFPCLAPLCVALVPQIAVANLGHVVCDDSARLEERLLSVPGARKEGQGMRGPDALLEMWVAPATGDWTLVQIYANGTSCIVAMGDNWERLTVPPDPI